MADEHQDKDRTEEKVEVECRQELRNYLHNTELQG